jgi:phospholipid-binding lipoprotein MlaA
MLASIIGALVTLNPSSALPEPQSGSLPRAAFQRSIETLSERPTTAATVAPSEPLLVQPRLSVDTVVVPPIPVEGGALPVLRSGDTTIEPHIAVDVSAPDLLPADDEIVVTASAHPANDPFKEVNRLSFEATQAVDSVVLAPIARVHKAVTPRPIRRGIRNFLNNLREPIVMVNFLLQLKIGKAAETTARFAINSILGVAGVADIAKRCPFNLPWRPNGFGDTLGVYGLKEGPYIFIPLLGPTTVRDLAGGVVDRVVSPLALGGAFKSRTYVLGTNIYRAIDRRAEMEDELREVRESDDPYIARRNLYLKKQEARVKLLRSGRRTIQRPEDPQEGDVQSEAKPGC